jgi:hypothetical protein
MTTYLSRLVHVRTTWRKVSSAREVRRRTTRRGGKGNFKTRVFAHVEAGPMYAAETEICSSSTLLQAGYTVARLGGRGWNRGARTNQVASKALLQ